MGIGLPEIAIVLVILLIVFGPKKLPSLGRGLGSGMREFKDGITGDEKHADEPEQLKAATPPAPPVVPAQPAEPVAPPAPAPVEQPAPPRTEE